MRVPMIPRGAIFLKPTQTLSMLSSLLRDSIPRTCRVIPTGSSALGIEGSNDLDVVIACRDSRSCLSSYTRLAELREIGILRRSLGALFVEWLNRHRDTLNLDAYIATKADSPLVGTFLGRVYTIRIVNLEFKPSRVVSSKCMPLDITIVKPLLDFTTPCRYVAEARGLGRVIFESYRMLFTHLPPRARVRALFRVELRADGLTYVIPDHSRDVVIELALHSRSSECPPRSL